MPAQVDTDHYLLHFRIERDDTIAFADIRRRSGVIVTAFESAIANMQTPLTFLIGRMTVIIGPGQPDADLIRNLAIELQALDQDNRPTELLAILQSRS